MIARENDRVLLISPDGKRYLLRLRSGDRFHTHKGIILHDELIDASLGRQVLTHQGHSFVALQPSIHDLLMRLKRVSQIIYPKEIGQILLKLDVGPGKRIIEAGTGSGALTLALAHSVRPEGRVYSYEAREDMLKVARRNLDDAGLLESVELVHRDIVEGFSEREVDSLFLDVRAPWEFLGQACEALVDGGFFGAIVPTTNQISSLLAGFASHPFTLIEVMEILVRQFKPVANRLRPQDRMVAHTGYLIFARKVGLNQSPRGEAQPGTGTVADASQARPSKPIPKSRRPNTVNMGSFWGDNPASEKSDTP